MIFSKAVAGIRPLALGAIVTLAGCTQQEVSVQLAHQLHADAGSYVTTLEQRLAVDAGAHAFDGVRELLVGHTIRAQAASPEADRQAVIRLDSVRASLVMGQQQQRYDTRDLPGREFTVAVPSAGGAPAYDGETMPVIDMGDMGGGAVPASLVIDYGFPSLPDAAVSVGSTWTEQRTRRQLEAVVWVTAHITTTYTVSGLDRVNGSPCLVVASESTGTLSDGFAHGQAMAYSGELEGSATWCFDTGSGVLLSMQSQETTRGRVESWNDASIDQTSTVAVHRVSNNGRGQP